MSANPVYRPRRQVRQGPAVPQRCGDAPANPDPDDDVPVPEPTPPVTDPRPGPAPPRPPAVPPDEDDGTVPPPVRLPGREGGGMTEIV